MNKILFCIEDPGSANFFLGLAESLVEYDIVAGGFSQNYLKQYNYSFLNLKNYEKIDLEKYSAVAIGTNEVKSNDLVNLLAKAISKKKKTIILIDTPTFIQERLDHFDKKILNKVDRFFVPDNKSKKFLATNFNPNKISVVIPNKFEFLRKSYFRKKKSQKNIVFFSNLSTGLKKECFIKNNNYGFSGFSNSNKRTEIIIEEFINSFGPLKNKYNFILRLHPKEKLEYYKKYSYFFSDVSQKENLVSLFAITDFAVGLSSNVLVEASFLGIPTMSITPLKKEFEWLNSFLSKKIINVSNRINLENAIPKFLNLGLQNCLDIPNTKRIDVVLNKLVC